jgi:PAS domain S-box-containing protein
LEQGFGPPAADNVRSGDAELQLAHERLVAALKASRCGTWRWTIVDDVVEWDEALSRVYGIAHASAPKTSREFLAFVHQDDRERVLAILSRCLESGSEIDYEFRAVIGDTVRWIYDRSTLVRDPAGKPLYMMGACLDITERRRIEEERNAALERQQLLFEELNHRIKNHLQLITGMLRMQAGREQNRSAKADFEKAIQRIQTIADLHVNLYRDDQFGLVDIQRYLREIGENLRKSIVLDSRISLEIEAESILLSVDQALPVGLLVNELVTNAVKHAFPQGQQGRILIRLRARGDRITLSVTDNGRGITKEPQTRMGGIGTRMVKALSRQIRGNLRVKVKQGTSYHLLFRVAARTDLPSEHREENAVLQSS